MYVSRMSTLSAEAPVFIPGKSWAQQAQNHMISNTYIPPQQQQHWRESGPMPYTPGMPWAGGDATPQTSIPQQWSQGDDQSPYTNSNWEPNYLTMVKDILYNLSISPGLFEDHMKTMVEGLNGTITTLEQLDAVADVIFEQSVLEPNFRYTGARTCDYLTSHLAVHNFRKPINRRLLEAVESRDLMSRDPTLMKRLHGVTMFLAELFLISELQVQGKPHPQRIAIYRIALSELMETLVNNATNENLKCLALLLKLAGKEIEDFDKAKDGTKVSDQLSRIFNKARQHILNSTINKNIRELWLQLIELRAKRWGQGEPSSYAAPSAGQEASYMPTGSGDTTSTAAFVSQPVFYNQQGQVISADEAGFGDESETDYDNYAEYQQYYDDNTASEQYTDYGSAAMDPYAEYDHDPTHYQDAAELDYADDLDELDAEIQAAFKDFLIETGQEGNS